MGFAPAIRLQGKVPLRLTLDEFAERARELVEQVRDSDETVVIRDGERALAVLASHASMVSMASVVDLPRWEGWLREMKDSFPEAAGRLAKLGGRDRQEPEEISKPSLGFDLATATVGSAAGRDFLGAELRRLGVPVVEEALLGTVYSTVIQLCEDKQHIYAEDLRVLAQETIAEAPQRLKLLAVTVTSSTGLPATAEVTLELGHGPAMRREHGDGPLDAAMRAIERLTNLKPEVENFSVVAATRGRDAIAEAVIELNLDGTVVIGAGASTDAIQAGVHAYVNALNFLLETRREEAVDSAELDPG